ncbi:DUF1289 domain-containing protein [Variovorax dokdonensis]|uniref:DUF1289 domain-containing protein n=1 Tax=Variovorax dokdonensis TaxID=344883 RepID=A0ABT7N4Z5_9BURK|nr:DUF1289 domain-containing protein [Variovorax dokdonensis]MDM0042993.1 DUF1289 domain-containing protein [Variovorax dokdonensis]
MNAKLAARADAVLAQPDGQPVISPCVSVCRMDPGSGLCIGCLRSLDEIAAWSAMDDRERRAVWTCIAERAASNATAPATEEATGPSELP